MTTLTAEAAPAAVDLQWHRVCQVDELETAWGEAALIDNLQIAVIRLSPTRIYAVDQRDPATGACVMSRGIVGDSGSRATLASPLHKEVYMLDTGECPGNTGLRLPTFPVQVADGAVLVGLPDGSARTVHPDHPDHPDNPDNPDNPDHPGRSGAAA